MNPLVIAVIVAIALLVYMIATHKIDTAVLHAKLTALEQKLGLVHAAALSPVLVAPAPAAPAVDPAKIVADAIAAAQAAAPPAAPAASANPFVAWKAQGKDLMWIQTWGLQHALSDDEWALAVAAGYEKPAAPAPDTSPAWVAKPTMTFAEAFGHPLPCTGPGSYTITDCPANVRVISEQASGQTNAGAYTLKANGLSKPWSNAQGTCVLDANGPVVVVGIDQAEGSHTQIFVQA